MPEVMIVTSGVTKGPLVTILAKRFGIRSKTAPSGKLADSSRDILRVVVRARA
jgi:hypothetical protein